MKILVAAAGSGGHINPAIAIANKISKENKDAQITFVGTTRGLENDLVPRAGYSLKTIEVYGISREISIQNIKKMYRTLKGFSQAKKIIKEYKPDLVIGTGGYICGPIFLAATENKIPTVLHESNAFPGMTIKMLSKKVDLILTGFEDAKTRLPKAKKVVVTGTPTKLKNLKLTDVQKNEIKVKLGFNTNMPLVLVFGGSQGASIINKTLINIIKNKMNKNYQIMWAAGPKQYDNIKECLKKENININNIKAVKIVPYIYNMEEVLNCCDLVVARSGAMTITEIAKVGKPAIFVPLAIAAENHQEYNSKVLVNKNAAYMILEKDLNENILNQNINDIVQDKDKMEQMGKNAQKIDIKDVEGNIYKEIKKYCDLLL